MRKTSIIFALLFLFIKVCLSNTNYFPLTVGNYWDYYDWHNPTTTNRFGVFDTSTFNGQVYYSYGISEQNITNRFRWDSTGVLYNYSEYYNNEYIWFDFNIALGETLSIYLSDGSFSHYTILLDDGVTVTCPAGTFENCKYVLFDNPELSHYEKWYWFAPDIGIVQQRWSYLTLMVLTSAQIDSQTVSVKVVKVPNDIPLLNNFPNPFNPVTTIDFTTSINSFVNLNVYNIMGSKVETLVNQKLNSGMHSVLWDGSDLPSGIYFIQLTSGFLTVTKKAILLK